MRFKNNPFPPIESADEDGLIAIGGDLTTDLLLCAYTQGIFPWPVSHKDPLAWFSPDPRGILPISSLHIPKSLKRFLNKCPYHIKYNTCFKQVIENCSSAPRVGQRGTWITKEITNAYYQLFLDGYAYSVEVYSNETNELVGGVYGVCIGSFISGESMFFKQTNASKFALIELLNCLKRSEIPFLDTQMVTPVTLSLGAIEVPRSEFVNSLQKVDWTLRRDQIFKTYEH